MLAGRTHRPLTIIALLLSMFMSALEATVVGTAMPTIIADLGGIAHYGWVGAAYLLASTVSVPVYGKIADLFGRKRVLLFGIVLFLAGSTASGFANDIWTLIAARAFQGLGAGAMQPIALTIVGDIFTIEERGKIQGVFGAVWAIAGVAGPLVGGAIVHFWSWPWVFWVNIPFGFASMLILSRAYHENIAEHEELHFDWSGAAALTTASLLLLLGASREYPALTLPAGAALFALFVHLERRAKDPVLPLTMFQGRGIAVATIASALLGATMMGTLIYVPLFAQGVLALPPTQAGASVAPMLVGWPVASALTSRMLTRIGFRPPVVLGSAMIAAILSWFAIILGGRPSLLAMQAAMFIYGFGMGVANTTLIIAVQSSVEWRQRGVATASALFARSMGGALGVGALGAVLAGRLGGTMSPEQVSAVLDPHADRGLASPEVIAALSSALGPIFWVVFALAALNLMIVLFYPRSGVPAKSAGVGEAAP
jgi:EmrB/QacA subfamily drug resistance transporter